MLLAFFVLRWSRGVLPVASALAIILLIFAAVSAPLWFDRDKSGFTSPALDESMLGMLTFLLIPLQLLLIAFAMRGFRQAWNVEVEHAADDDGRERPGGERPGRRRLSRDGLSQGHRRTHGHGAGRRDVEGRAPVVAGAQAPAQGPGATSLTRAAGVAGTSASTASTTHWRSWP